ncbi:MAG: aminotransferase class IV [Actinomycetia bacterium]|nr:aminotransferase class IV [Actinomycetes bacterium]
MEFIDYNRPHVPGAPAVPLRETCRVAADKTIPLWSYHARRLVQGGCSREVVARVTEAVEEALGRYSEPVTSRVRLTAIVLTDGTPSITVERRLSSLDAPRGVRGVPIVMPRPPVLPSGAAKPADRSYWDAAQRRAREKGGDQAIIMDEVGTILDGGTATVMLRKGRTLTTPPVPHAVAGVARAWVIDHAGELGVRMEIRPLIVEDLDRSDETVFVNAYGGARAMQGKADNLATRIDARLKKLWGF